MFHNGVRKTLQTTWSWTHKSTVGHQNRPWLLVSLNIIIPTLIHAWDITMFWHGKLQTHFNPNGAGISIIKGHVPKNDEECTHMKSIPYLKAVGSVMYLTTTTWRHCIHSRCAGQIQVKSGTRRLECCKTPTPLPTRNCKPHTHLYPRQFIQQNLHNILRCRPQWVQRQQAINWQVHHKDRNQHIKLVIQITRDRHTILHWSQILCGCGSW